MFREEEGDFVCTMSECKINQIRHPKWIKKDLGSRTSRRYFDGGRLLFRACATVPQFCARLKIEERNRRKDSVEKDRAAFKSFYSCIMTKLRIGLQRS